MNQQQFEHLRANRHSPRAVALLAGAPEQRLLRSLAEQARRRQRLLDAIAAASGGPAGLEDCDFELAGTRLCVRAATPACLRQLQSRRAAVLRALRQAGLAVRALELTLRQGERR